MQTERVSLPDNNWWDIKAVLTRGMRKEIDKAAQHSIPYQKAKEEGVDLENPEALKGWLLANPDYLASTVVDDAMLLIGTDSWSFNMPISPENIDLLPDEHCQKVLAKMRELYYPTKREQMADFFGRR